MPIEGARYATLAVTSAGSKREMQRSMVADKEAQASLAGPQSRIGRRAAARQGWMRRCQEPKPRWRKRGKPSFLRKRSFASGVAGT